MICDYEFIYYFLQSDFYMIFFSICDIVNIVLVILIRLGVYMT